MKMKRITCLLLLPILLLAAFCYETNPFANQALGDCTWFAYMGRMWLNGHVPFLEYFDHKGPMVFFLNMMGLAINYDSYIGIWLIEMAFLMLSIKVVYSYVARYCNEYAAIITVTCVTSALLKCVSPCDNIESFSYPIATFCFIRFITIVKDRLRIVKKDAFLFGLSFMFLFLMKANLVSVAFVIAIYYFYELYLTKNIHEFVTNSLMTFLGMAVIFIPFVIYFYLKGAVYDVWYCAIEFNIKYASESAKYNPLLWGVLAINVYNFILLFVRSADYKVLVFNQLFVMITGLTLLHCPTYDHYYAMLLPGVVPLVVETLQISRGAFDIKKVLFICLYILSFCVLSVKTLTANLDVKGWINHVRNGGHLSSFVDFKEGCQFSETLPFLDKIADKNSVLCFGRFGLYEYLRVTTKFKYFLHTTGAINEQIREASMQNLKERNDKYVIAYKEDTVEEWNRILQDGYNVIDESDKFILFERKQ